MKDPRLEDTPVPEVERQRVDDELKEYLAFKRSERARGFTNEALYRTMMSLTRSVQEHDKKLGTHDRELRALREWQEDHARLHAKSDRPLPMVGASLPPPRGQMDTGKYEIHLADLQRAIEITQAEFAAYKQGELVEENREMKEKIDWWWKWAVGALSAALAAVLGWIAARAGMK